jgi:hypothetical protein
MPWDLYRCLNHLTVVLSYMDSFVKGCVMEMHYPPLVADPPAHPVVVALALAFTTFAFVMLVRSLIAVFRDWWAERHQDGERR